VIDATMTIQVASAANDGEQSRESLHRVSVVVTNRSTWNGSVTSRDDALRHTLASAHVVLQSANAQFVSTEDPPRELAASTDTLRNDGLWPTLVGERGDRGTVLASPIILGDYPRIAPESSGDFFDGGEIDQMLVLNVLTLTDAEQAEMSATDPRAREILERCRTMEPRTLLRLHATMRRERFAEPAPLSLFTELDTIVEAHT
jgi:hydrogenase maturation protease